MHFWEKLFGVRMGDSNLIEFRFLAGWLLIPVSGSVHFVYSHQNFNVLSIDPPLLM